MKPGPIAPGSKSPKPRGKPFTKDDPRIDRDAQWKPGQSGNPSGMPKNRAAAAAHIERRLREEFIDQAIDALKYHTVKGSAAHMIEALNRMAGKVTDKQDVSFEVGPVLDAIAEGIKDIPGAAERILPLLKPLIDGT